MLGLLTGLRLLELWHLIYPRLDRVSRAGLLHKLKCYGISGQIYGLISSFLSNRWLQVVLDRKSSQEYPVNAVVPQGSILYDIPDDVICDIPIYADDTTVYSKCDQASDLWQQPELASELASDLQELGQKKNNTLVSRNVGDKKNLHSGGHKEVFFINLIEFFE